MASLTEGLKVWVRQSNSGYQGPAILVGLIFGSSWLVKKLEGDESIILVRAEFISVISAKIADLIEAAPPEERHELKKKIKAERKNARPSNGGRGTRR